MATIADRMNHPATQWGLVIAIIAIGLTSFKMINAVENQVNSNTLQLGFEQVMRVAGQEQIEEDLDELSTEIKEVKKLVEEGQQTVETLLRELLDQDND